MSENKWWNDMVEALGKDEAMECAASDHLTLGISVSISAKDPGNRRSEDITYTGYGQPKGPDRYELRGRVDTIPESIGTYKDKGWHTKFEFEGSQLNAVLEHLYEGHPDAIALRREELRDYSREETLVLTGYWD